MRSRRAYPIQALDVIEGQYVRDLKGSGTFIRVCDTELEYLDPKVYNGNHRFRVRLDMADGSRLFFLPEDVVLKEA